MIQKSKKFNLIKPIMILVLSIMLIVSGIFFALSFNTGATVTAETKNDKTPELLTFTAIEDSGATIKFKSKSGAWSYTTDDGANWIEVPAQQEETISLSKDQSVKLKGTNVVTSSHACHFTITDGKVSASGDVTSLTNGSGGDARLASSCYEGMFYECTALTSAPALPSTQLAESCYKSMFFGCTSLTNAPALPATTLAESCYSGMFYDCTALTSAPALPATELKTACYYGMFYDCTALTTAPALPAKSLSDSCYYGMFTGCTSLTNAPALPATSLSDSCYYCMFYYCTALTSAPALPATSLSDSCYYAMFAESGLTTAPALPATQLAESCYYGMFYGCTSLTAVPQLAQATNLSNETHDCYASMFENCSNLEVSTDPTAYTKSTVWKSPSNASTYCTDMFTDISVGTVEVEDNTDYYISNSAPLTFTAQEANATVIFKYLEGTSVQYRTKASGTWGNWTDCPSGTEISLANIGDQVQFKGTNVVTNINNHFTITSGKVSASGDVTSLTNGVGGDATLADNCYSHMFSGCTGLTTAPALPSTSLASSCYEGMFYECTGLTTAPALPATSLASSCYDGMFSGCTGLTTAPALPSKQLAESCYFYMFYGCTNLTTAPELPATSLSDSCYDGMFCGCTALTTAPALPATELKTACYSYMFAGCTRLTTAPALPSTQLAESCYCGMFARSGLTTAPALPSTQLAESCYCGMFAESGLTTAPALPATTLARYCYNYMFYNCTNLVLNYTATKGTEKTHSDMRLKAISFGDSTTTEPTGWNEHMFTGCTNVDLDGQGGKTPLLNTVYYTLGKGVLSPDTTAQTTATYTGSGISYQITYPQGTQSALQETTGWIIQYYVNDAWTTDAPTNVGTYDVKISRVADSYFAAYAEQTIPGGLVIEQAVITTPTIKAGVRFVYNGQGQQLITDNFDNWDTKLTLTCDSVIVAGDCSATIKVSDDYKANYTLKNASGQKVETINITWTINKATAPTVEIVADKINVTYTKNNFGTTDYLKQCLKMSGFVESEEPTATTTFKITQNGKVVEEAINVGTYTINYTYEYQNYATVTGKFTLKINKKTINLKKQTVETGKGGFVVKDEDGTEIASTVSYAKTGSTDWTLEVPDTAGTYDVKVEISDPNYKVESSIISGGFVVTAPVTPTGCTFPVWGIVLIVVGAVGVSAGVYFGLRYFRKRKEND